MVIEKLTKSTLGLPCSPAKWLDGPEYRKIKRLKVSHRDGIGGTSWYEYIDRDNWYVEESYGAKFLCVRRLDGKEVLINPLNIVEIENFTLMTAWYEPDKRYFKTGIMSVNYLIEDGKHNIKLLGEFEYSGKE